MVADPSQQEDLAAERPDLAAGLTAAYERWYSEIAENGFRRPPIPVGHAPADLVTLGPSAANLSGEVRFANSLGWTTDWITNWRSPDDRIVWQLDVARPGRYQVTLLYACGAEETGSTVRVTCGGQAIEGTIRQPFDSAKRIRPDRVADRPWTLRRFTGQLIGVITLPEGECRMELRVTRVPSGNVGDLGGLRVRRVE